jgi:hypothetical protein
MLDKQALQNADIEVLIAAAVECCRLQQAMFGRDDPFEEAWVLEFQQLEEVRSYILHLVDWKNSAELALHQEALRELQNLDQQNNTALTTGRDELASRLRQLRMKREMSSEYLSFQMPEGP